MIHTRFYIQDLTFVKIVSESDKYIYLPLFYGSMNRNSLSWSLKLFNLMVGKNLLNGRNENLREVRKGWSAIAKRIKDGEIEVFFGEGKRKSVNFIEDIMDLEKKALVSSRTLHDYELNQVEFFLRVSSKDGSNIQNAISISGELNYFEYLYFCGKRGMKNIVIMDMVPRLQPMTSVKDIITNVLYHESFARPTLRGGLWYALHMGQDNGYFYGYYEKDAVKSCLFRKNIRRAALFPSEDDALVYLSFLFKEFPYEGSLEQVVLEEYIKVPCYPYYLNVPNQF